MTNPRNNRYVEKLCGVLNESETIFPGTNLRLFIAWYQSKIQRVRSSEGIKPYNPH
jgi:hypothetical protein